MTVDRRSYTSGHFELAIDGHTSTAYLRSMEGGFVSAATIEEPIGSENKRIKHMATVDVEPFTIDFSLAGAKNVIQWISDSWNKQYSRRNGQITHADFNLKSTFEHHFTEALISETTFPTLDGSSKDAGYMKLKIQPETVKTMKSADGKPLAPANIGTKHLMWMPSGFRFAIDGLDEMRYVNKIESFTVKQGIKKFYTGEGRFPQIEPTKLEFPTISGTIALEYASQLLKWHDEYVVQGKKDDKQQKSGGIEFLAPDRTTVIFRINLKEVGVSKVAIESSKAGAETIKRVAFTLFVGHMELTAEDPGLES